MQALLDEEPRDWNAKEILAELDRRGLPIAAQDPENALRAAIYEANRDEKITRSSPGRYKSTKFGNVSATFKGEEETIYEGSGPGGGVLGPPPPRDRLYARMAKSVDAGSFHLPAALAACEFESRSGYLRAQILPQ